MSVIGSNVLAGASGQSTGDFEISRSLRFNSADSANLSKTFGSASNRKTFTFSCWVKKSASSASNPKTLFGVYGGSAATSFTFRFDSSTDDTLRVENNFAVGAPGGRTQAVFRDYSGWMHVVLSMDTRESGISTGMKIYVNGVEQSLQNTVWTQDVETLVNSTNAHYIGSQGQANSYFDGYLAECILVDGSALDPTSFGQADSDGVWRPKDTAGLTFGTNGFRLKFADNSGATATTLGKDTSGNSNNWTPNNLSVGAVSSPTAKQNFDVLTYTGTGSAQSITGLSFQPDFVWLKRTSQAADHCLSDSVRGFGASGSSKLIYSSVTNAEETGNTQIITSFNSNGFTLGTNGLINGSGHSHVAWCWKAGGAASSNTDGTITSSVSANASYGFSICTYTGNNTSGASVGHSLNAVPALIILKDRSSAYNWQVYHKSFAGTSNSIVLNSSSGIDTGSGSIWNSTTPTSTVFSIGNSVGVNKSGDNYVAYVWSEIAGFSKFGSFSHPSTTSIDFGFTPRFWLVKETDGTTPWYIFDAERDNFDDPLFANTSGTAGSGFAFTVSGTTISWIGGSFASGNYIYAAFAATVDESAINDCFVDSPTNAAEPSDSGVGNEVVGNYATLNPLAKGPNTVLSNGNLNYVGGAASQTLGTFGMSSGKWYWEDKKISGTYGATGIATGDVNLSNHAGQGSSWAYNKNGNKWHNGSQSSYGATWTDGDVIGIAFDADAGSLSFYKNGVSQGVAYTGLTSGPYFSTGCDNATTGVYNFGQRAFAYTAPSGYKSLNTANLPTPTIADGRKYFDTKLWTGSGSSRSITGYSFSPDWVWIKERNGDVSHQLYDIVRGATKKLSSNSTDSETTTSDGLTAFNADGFSLGSYSSVNNNNDTYAGWAWDGGTSTVTNNDGSIASQVRAQPSAGFSIVSWSVGTAVNNSTIGHGLGAAPSMIICKTRNASNQNWIVYHKDLGTGDYLALESTQGSDTRFSTIWGTSAPNSTVFGVGTTGFSNNSSNNNYIAYCFAPVAGYSAVGSYQNPSSSDGAFVHLGFRPAFLLIKCAKNISSSSNTGDWLIKDTTRSPSNNPSDGNNLVANLSAAEDSQYSASQAAIDILSNGFKIRHPNSSPGGDPGRLYVFYAVAENPFQANGGLAR